MGNFLTKLFNKKVLSFNETGVLGKTSKGDETVIEWGKINKIVFLDTFEEYSGYFLTEDYANKVLYNDISIACDKNVVKIRTGGSPKVKKNTPNPFSMNFGTASIYYPVFFEYLNAKGEKNIYASHYNNSIKLDTIEEIKNYIGEEKIRIKKKLEGFSPLSLI